MARVAATTTEATVAGATVTQTAFTADGISMPPGARLLVENTSGGSATITVQTPETVEGLAVGEATVTVANNAIKWIGPFAPATFVRPSGGSDAGLIWVDSSVTTGCTWAVLD